MTDLPAPLTDASVDVAGLPGFMLNVVRLLSSELVAISTGDEFKAAVLLWSRSWQQVPACSLPEDERVLASFAGLGSDMKKWRKVRPVALRGFVPCSDGRLYHPVLVEDAKRASKARQQRRDAISRRYETKPPEPLPVPTAVATAVPPVQGRDETKAEQQEAAPPDAVRQLAKRAVDVLRKLQEICGVDENRKPAWARVDAVTGWLQAGADPDLDVFPAARAVMVRETAKGNGPPGSASYLTNAVMDAMRARLAGASTTLVTPAVVADPAREAAAQRFNAAMDAWIAKGREGPKPELSDFLAKPESQAA